MILDDKRKLFCWGQIPERKLQHEGVFFLSIAVFHVSSFISLFIYGAWPILCFSHSEKKYKKKSLNQTTIGVLKNKNQMFFVPLQCQMTVAFTL